MILPFAGASSPFVGLRPDVEGSVKIKVAALTGLHSETSSTETDVVNHIPGGHTDIHVDTVSKPPIKIKLGALTINLLCEGSQRIMPGTLMVTVLPL